MTDVSGSVTVGIDIGTTAVKAVAVDGEGRILARSRVGHRLRTPEPDHLEHDAGRAWRRGPLQALAEVLAAVDEPAGVCVASMVPSLTIVDARGRPCAPGLLYGDARGRPAAPGASPSGPAEVESVMPDAVGFLRWAVGQLPGARGYWPAQAVANYALGRVPAIDTAMAMSLGALMTAGQWDPGVLDSLGVTPGQLPTVVPMAQAAGTVTGTDTVIAAGTVDALCDQIVSGADQAGDVLVICGATLVVWAVVDEWIEVPGLWTVPHTVPGKVLVGGPSNAGALFVDWARGLLHEGFRRAPRPKRGDVVTPHGEEPARTGDPGRVPVWLPYVRGERAPFHDHTLRAGLYDLDITHDATAVERAAYEASGFVVRAMLDRAGIKARRIVASGGGTRVVPWMQAMADAAGLPVDVVAVHEGAALGAAFVARVAAGLEPSIDGAGRWSAVGARIDPDPRWQKAADDRYARFVALGPST
ncbi:MAG TPA: FGGY-family carbohydrate kinase [Acidimicrobiales bacterium]|nr:FGGY-family carbohydrate kinase [Acidimicrobiales bacterium]